MQHTGFIEAVSNTFGHFFYLLEHPSFKSFDKFCFRVTDFAWISFSIERDNYNCVVHLPSADKEETLSKN